MGKGSPMGEREAEAHVRPERGRQFQVKRHKLA